MNDWIDWHGGDCPVPTGTKVELKFRGEPGKVCGPGEAFNYCWDTPGASCDIIAYRVHTPAAKPTVVNHPKTGAEVIYLHTDCVELKVFGTCTRDAMEKLHSFVGGMLEHRDFS